MSVNFAAVHQKKRWRKHSKHLSLQAATEGKDGAEKLLLGHGRVAEMKEKYGPILCVFVWEDQDPSGRGKAFRLENNSIESVSVPLERIEHFDARRECSLQEIAECFRNDDAPKGVTPRAAPLVSSDDTSIKRTSVWPDDLPEGKAHFEGLAQQVIVNRYERSADARAACIAHHGCVCQVCRMDFGKRYGELGQGFIHVHHVLPISAFGNEYCVDPVADLVPVCPNCHAMFHMREPPLAIERLRELLCDG